MLLEVASVTKRFGGLTAVDQTSLRVEEGEIVGLVGPNGAGKTTLLNVIAGVYRPDGGSIRFRGEEIAGLSPAAICRKGIARTFQISRCFPKMSVFENVYTGAVFGDPKKGQSATLRAADALRLVQFPMPPSTPADKLNAIQLKRLDLARALATNPTLLLLDESATGLIPSELVDMMGIVCDIRNHGISVIVVEHVMRVIMGICDRVVVLHYGKKIADSTPDGIVNDETVVNAYLGEKFLL